MNLAEEVFRVGFIALAQVPCDDKVMLSVMFVPMSRTDESFITSSTIEVGVLGACEGDELFFPFVTTMTGWDTGLVLINNSIVDGNCSLNWGDQADLTDAQMEALSTIDVAAKGHKAFLVSMQRGADYSGSLGVKCTFMDATGYVFLSDTANGIGQGYLVKPE